MESLFRTLKILSEAFGVAGFEDEIRAILANELKPLVDEAYVDSFGNVVGILRGEDEDLKVMLTSHMDEVGLMVTHVEESGFLRFTEVGAMSPTVLPGQRVVIRAKGRKVYGVIGIRPHLAEDERKKVPEVGDMFIDIGVSSREEAGDLGIAKGCVATVDGEVRMLANGKAVTGKAFDDRVGCAVLIEALKMLRDSRHEATACIVMTVQEEVGLRGAQVAAYRIAPKMAIAVDVTVANDVPGVSEKDYVARIGKGPAIKVMDRGARAPLGLIAHPRIRELLMRTAEEEGIPYQLEILIGGTTDASAISLVREGIPSGVVSIPCRYAHSPTELISLEDAYNAARLIASSLRRITRSNTEELILAWG